jgi:hypothetical protein
VEGMAGHGAIPARRPYARRIRRRRNRSHESTSRPATRAPPGWHIPGYGGAGVAFAAAKEEQGPHVWVGIRRRRSVAAGGAGGALPPLS